jgi:hypothetical protein
VARTACPEFGYTPLRPRCRDREPAPPLPCHAMPRALAPVRVMGQVGNPAPALFRGSRGTSCLRWRVKFAISADAPRESITSIAEIGAGLALPRVQNFLDLVSNTNKDARDNSKSCHASPDSK